MGKFLLSLVLLVLLAANAGLLWEHRQVLDKIETILTDLQTIKTEQANLHQTRQTEHAELLEKIQAIRCADAPNLEAIEKSLQEIKTKLDEHIEQQINMAEQCLSKMLKEHNKKSRKQWQDIINRLKGEINRHHQTSERCQKMVRQTQEVCLGNNSLEAQQ